MAAFERSVEMSEPRLLDDRGRPRVFLEYYALTRDGTHGAATMHQPRDEERQFNPRLEPIAHLYTVDQRPDEMIM